MTVRTLRLEEIPEIKMSFDKVPTVKSVRRELLEELIADLESQLKIKTWMNDDPVLTIHDLERRLEREQ